jgi:hypothetical protein
MPHAHKLTRTFFQTRAHTAHTHSAAQEFVGPHSTSARLAALHRSREPSPEPTKTELERRLQSSSMARDSEAARLDKILGRTPSDRA